MKCGHQTCTSTCPRSPYAVNGRKKAIFCAHHDEDGMLAITGRTCTKERSSYAGTWARSKNVSAFAKNEVKDITSKVGTRRVYQESVVGFGRDRRRQSTAYEGLLCNRAVLTSH